MRYIKLKSTYMLFSLSLLFLTGCGGGSGGSDNDSELVSQPNQNPIVLVENGTVDEYEQMTISSNASDPDGTITSYLWEQLSGTNIETTGTASATLTFTAPEVIQNETLVFRLTVTDNEGATAQANVNIEIINNDAPTVTVNSISAKEKESIQLIAQAEDADGSISSYNWIQTSGPEVQLSSISEETISFQAPEIVENTTLTFSVIVTDDDGDTATVAANVNLEAIKLALNIQGQVVASEPATSLTAFIGSLTFETESSEDGTFEFNFTVDEAYNNHLLRIESVGKDENLALKMVSIVSDLETLLESADAAGLITFNEQGTLNITHASSAYAALIYKENNQSFPITEEELHELPDEFDHSAIIPMATTSKLVSTSRASFLPDEIANSFELLKNYEQAREINQLFKNDHFDEYENAKNELLNNNDILSSDLGADVSLHGIHYIYENYRSNIGQRVLLETDGKGFLETTVSQSSFSWQESQNNLIINFEGDGPVISVGNGSVAGYEGLYSWSVHRDKSELKFIPTPSGYFIMVATHYDYRKYPPNQAIPDTSPEAVGPETAIVFSKMNQSITFKLGTSYSIPIPVNTSRWLTERLNNNFEDQSREAITFELLDQQTAKFTFDSFLTNGTIIQHEITSNYSIDTDNKLTSTLTAQNQNDLKLTISPVKQASLSLVNVKIKEQGRSEASYTHKLLEKKEDWSGEKVVGVYELEDEFDEENHYYWLELNPENSGQFIRGADSDKSGTLDSGEVRVSPLTWELDNENTLKIKRHTCDRLSPETCVVYHDRHWQLHQIENEYYYFKQKHLFYDTVNTQGESPNEDFEYPLIIGTVNIVEWKKRPHRPIPVTAVLD